MMTQNALWSGNWIRSKIVTTRFERKILTLYREERCLQGYTLFFLFLLLQWGGSRRCPGSVLGMEIFSIFHLNLCHFYSCKNLIILQKCGNMMLLLPFHCCICLCLNMFVYYILFVCLFVLYAITPPACGLTYLQWSSVLFCSSCKVYLADTFYVYICDCPLRIIISIKFKMKNKHRKVRMVTLHNSCT